MHLPLVPVLLGMVGMGTMFGIGLQYWVNSQQWEGCCPWRAVIIKQMQQEDHHLILLQELVLVDSIISHLQWVFWETKPVAVVAGGRQPVPG